MSTESIELSGLPTTEEHVVESPATASLPGSKYGHEGESTADRSLHDTEYPDSLTINLGREDPAANHSIAALPPVDRGRQAWVFLLAATVVEMLVWGLPYSVGVLHAYWKQTLFPDASAGTESTLTLAATLQTGLLYITAAIFGPLFQSFPRYQMHFQLFGSITATTALIGSAFVTKPWHLVLLMGCIYPAAGALYYPAVILLLEWFVERRGLAGGIMYAGTGAGGAILPIIMSGLLNRFGYRTAMLSLGIGFGLLTSIASLGVKKRVPLGGDIGPGPRGRGTFVPDFRFVRRWTMYAGSIVVFLTGMGSLLPSLWIPLYTDDLPMQGVNGAVLVAIMNAASVPAYPILGYVSDRVPVRIIIFATAGVATLACLVLWGLGTASALLVPFAIFWGVSGLSFSALWTKMVGAIAQDDAGSAPLVFSSFFVLKGIGTMASGPISDKLLSYTSLTGSFGGYGLKGYGPLIAYTGAVMLGGGIVGLSIA